MILLSYSDLPIQEADAQDADHAAAPAQSSPTPPACASSIVSEMMDLRNRALAQIARADDFIVSDKLVSLMMSQLSENKNLEQVFKLLFSSEGSEIYIRPMTDYIRLGSTVDFYTVLEAAAQRGETAIGYRLMKYADDKDARVWCEREPEEVGETQPSRKTTRSWSWRRIDASRRELLSAGRGRRVARRWRATRPSAPIRR